MTLDQVLALAREHLPKAYMQSSAQMCIDTAERQQEAGEYDLARKWAVRSLTYSIGVLHPDYVKAAEGGDL